MPTAITQGKTLKVPYDPLEPLAEAIGSMLKGTAGKKQATAGSLSFQVASALHQVLEAATPQSRTSAYS